MIRFFCLLFCAAGLFGCASSEKTSYDSLILKQKKQAPDKQSPLRSLAHLKKLSQPQDSYFQFTAKQMKKVIKNYNKMKKQLAQIESKLDKILNQYMKDFAAAPFSKAASEKKSYAALIQEISKGRLNLNKEAEKELLSSLKNKEEPAALIEDILDGKWGLNNEDKTYLLEALGYKEPAESRSAPSIEEEITEDTDIFQESGGEEMNSGQEPPAGGEKEEPQNQEKSRKTQTETLNNTNLKKTPSVRGEKKKAKAAEGIASLKKAKELFKNKAYEKAISEFQKYRDENPKGRRYAEASFYLGQSFKKLKMPAEANIFFKEIAQSQPQSLWARRAKKLLKE